ncbi:MAG TPA: hypothetical protein VMM35_05230 [Longimicrobiales bacterium]|nr:hypothetical protein [Longimicrobiales bacterium]
MSARFRIRTKEGQELSFASHEVFAEFVRSGDLSPDDVVYDAETREWSSAETHPVVLQIQYEAEDDEAAGAEDDAEEREAPGPDETDEGERPAAGIDLDLAPAPAGLTPEQQAAAFVAKMEAERASERDFDEDLPGFKMEKGTGSVVEHLAPPPPPPPEPKPPRKEAQPPPTEPPPRREPSHVREPAPRERAPHPERPTAVPAAPRRKAGSPVARKYAPFAILGLAAVAAAVYFGPELLGPAAGEIEPSGPEATVEPPPPPPEIPATEEALRARARERFLASTQAALRGLQPVPDTWLRGSYLAAPSDHPRVREVWESYVTTIREVRAGDDERYRQAYLRALDDARVVEGGARTLRLSGALNAFQASAPGRAAHYDRVEALALAAIRGHDALVQAEGTIMHQPASGPALSGDPVIEAVGRSADAQALLNQVLDAVLAELHGESGPGEASNVREWVWVGFLDAVTR